LILETHSLSVNLGKTLMLSYPDVSLSAGDRLLVSGASGSGKTTLLNAVAGALPTTGGKLSLLDQPFQGLSSRQLDKLRADHMGIVFQQLNLIPYLTGLQNAALPLRFSAMRRTRVPDPLAEVVRLGKLLGLTESQLNQKANQLSVGQQQRVAVIRAFLGEPELILADEPTSALDPVSRDRFLDDVMALLDDKRQALLMISHDPAVASHFNQHLELG